MHFAEFKAQTLSRQAGLLCREGVYLSSRTDGNYFIALYGLFDFYAEVYCFRPAGELLMITSFQGASLLEPYLEKIDLQGVLLPVTSS